MENSFMRRLLPLTLLIGLVAGTAHAQEREWSFDSNDEEAYLIFGVPDSDDVGVSLWCKAGRGSVNLYLPVPTADIQKTADKSAPLTIMAGKETVTFRGKADINVEGTMSSVEAEIALDHPLVAALRTADRFTAKSGPVEVVFPLYDAELEDLLAICKKR